MFACPTISGSDAAARRCPANAIRPLAADRESANRSPEAAPAILASALRYAFCAPCRLDAPWSESRTVACVHGRGAGRFPRSLKALDAHSHCIAENVGVHRMILPVRPCRQTCNPVLAARTMFAFRFLKESPSVVMQAYCDESGINDTPVCVVAGWVATAETWESCENSWQEQSGGVDFHGFSSFLGNPTDSESALTRAGVTTRRASTWSDLFETIVGLNLIPIGAVIDADEFRAVVKGERPSPTAEDLPTPREPSPSSRNRRPSPASSQ